MKGERKTRAKASQPMAINVKPDRIGFFGPTLSSNRPEIGARIAPIAAPGSITNPAVKASFPKTSWTKFGKTKEMPSKRN